MTPQTAKTIKLAVDLFMKNEILGDEGTIAQISYLVEARNSVTVVARTRNTDMVLWIINARGPITDHCYGPTEVHIDCVDVSEEAARALSVMAESYELESTTCPKCQWPIRLAKAISVRDDVGPAQIDVDSCDACGWKSVGPSWTVLDE